MSQAVTRTFQSNDVTDEPILQTVSMLLLFSIGRQISCHHCRSFHNNRNYYVSFDQFAFTSDLICGLNLNNTVCNLARINVIERVGDRNR